MLSTHNLLLVTNEYCAVSLLKSCVKHQHTAAMAMAFGQSCGDLQLCIWCFEGQAGQLKYTL